MAISKIILNGVTQMDLTADTVATGNLLTGETAHDAGGNAITGTYEGGGGGWTTDGIATNTEPNGDIVLSNQTTHIGEYAFYNKPITSITGSAVTTIGTYAFRGTQIKHITDANFPLVWGTSARMARQFSYMGELLDIKLSGKIRFDDGSGVLQYCSKLVSMEFPNGQPYACGNAAFRNNTALVIADLGGVTNVGTTNCFVSCSALRTLVLRRTASVCNLGAWSATSMGGIYSNPSASTIYVPEALLTSYQTATNWSTAYAAGLTFQKIEGSIYDD